MNNKSDTVQKTVAGDCQHLVASQIADVYKLRQKAVELAENHIMTFRRLAMSRLAPLPMRAMV